MPLHLQYKGTARTPDGRALDIPAPLVLRTRGPAVEIAVAVSAELEQALSEAKQPVAAPITGLALIDTGAASTCVDETVAQKLGVSPIDVVRIASASHAQAEKSVYPVRLRLLGTTIEIAASRAIGVPLQPQGFIALLGRDFLERFVLIYNGSAGEMTLGL